jgi:hypothetical protein
MLATICTNASVEINSEPVCAHISDSTRHTATPAYSVSEMTSWLKRLNLISILKATRAHDDGADGTVDAEVGDVDSVGGDGADWGTSIIGSSSAT